MSESNTRDKIPPRVTSTCTNCSKTLTEGVYTFDGVLCCKNCYKIADFKAQRCRKELQMTYQTYRGMLRIAMTRKQLNLPTVPVEGETSVDEIAKELESAIKEIHGKVPSP